MKRSQLKQLIKPIVKECITESLIEEGILSNIISEVMKGAQVFDQKRDLNESKEQQLDKRGEQKRLLEQKHKKDLEKRKKLLNATGFKNDLFENTIPLTDGGVEGSGQSSRGALSGVDPSDPGVDITGIMALGGKKWKNLI
tara:strand:- start:3910 stop:4332 length:423 start_codon:yes stop_codon:yes gene_type:complete